MNLRIRLTLLIVAMALVSTLILAQRSLNLSVDQIKTHETSLLAGTARTVGHHLQLDLSHRAEQIRALSQYLRFQNSDLGVAEIRSLLAELKASYAHLAWIGLTDTQGRIVLDSDDFLVGQSVAERTWFLDGREGIAFGDAHEAVLLAPFLPANESSRPARLIDISAPVRDTEGQLKGVLGAHLSLAWADDIRRQMLTDIDDPEIDILILNRDGQLVLESFGERSEPQDLTSFYSTLIDPERPQYAETPVRWPDGVDYLTAISSFEPEEQGGSLGWTVVARKPMAVALQPATQMVEEIVAISLIVLISFVLLLWFSLNRLFKPLEAIARIANQINRNQLDTAVPEVKGDNEIAVFARSLINLVNTLRDKNHELILADRLFNENRLGIMITDTDRNILRVNAAFTDYTGYLAHEVVGKNPSILSSGQHDRAFYDEMSTSLMLYGSWRGEIWNRHKSGRIYPEWLTITALYDDDGRVANYMAMFEDISEKKGVERKLELLENYDILTNLPNRSRAINDVQQAVAAKKLAGGEFAVLLINIIQFKQVNDSFGHQVGDSLIRRFAQRLNAFIPYPGFVARWGGDEFLVFADDCDAEQAAELAGKLISAMMAPFSVDQREHHLRIGCGIALYPRDAGDADALLRCADVAMAESTSNRQQPFFFYQKAMNERALQRMELETRLRQATEQQMRGFELVYQPQYLPDAKTVKGFEALLRWTCTERGPVRPDLFIPIAESNGLIIPIGDWVLEQACQTLSQLLEQQSTLTMSVNISGVQLQNPELLERLCESADRHHLPRNQLIVEVTETAFTGDEERANQMLRDIREAGFGVSIDDFGTGYASLDYIQRFRPTEIKIDRVFVDKMLTDEHCLNIVKFTLGMAENLNLEVVAEGVETEEQLDRLRQLGQPVIQGYLLAKPQPIEALLALIAER